MLFEIEEELALHLDRLTIKELIFIENLGLRLIDGVICIYASRRTLKILSDLDSISHQTRGIFIKLYEGFTQLKSYYDSVNVMIRIVLGDSCSSCDDGRNIICLSYRDIKNEIFDKPFFICEYKGYEINDKKKFIQFDNNKIEINKGNYVINLG
ncbi:MAG: hypothetical protein ACOWWR_05410, partial [Eubacteriales bacterium]